MLSDDQTNALRAEAERLGVDADALIAEAERQLSGGSASSSNGAKPATEELPPLYMYHLPFVTVNEVRERWLGLDPVTGGEQYAAEWSAAQLAKIGGPPAPIATGVDDNGE